MLCVTRPVLHWLARCWHSTSFQFGARNCGQDNEWLSADKLLPCLMSLLGRMVCYVVTQEEDLPRDGPNTRYIPRLILSANGAYANCSADNTNRSGPLWDPCSSFLPVIPTRRPFPWSCCRGRKCKMQQIEPLPQMYAPIE